MKAKVYTVYADPGHAWVKVPLEELKELGIAEKISSYSYMSRTHAYLEEDCDLTLFAETKKAKGEELKFKESWSNKSSKIREYSRFNADFALNPVKIGDVVKIWDGSIATLVQLHKGLGLKVSYNNTVWKVTSQKLYDYVIAR